MGENKKQEKGPKSMQAKKPQRGELHEGKGAIKCQKCCSFLNKFKFSKYVSVIFQKNQNLTLFLM
jgi:hypothetical protein